MQSKKNLLFRRSILFFSFVLALTIPMIVSGQNSWKFEHYSYLNSGLRQSFTLTGRHALSNKWGFDTYVTVKNNMGGGTLGFDYIVNSWLQAGVLGGYDIQLSSVVFIPYIAVKKNNVLFTAAYLRIGEVLDLYELAVSYNWKYVKAGAIARNYFGVGPRLDVKIPKTPSWLWAAGLYEWKKENYGLMLGLIIPMSQTIKLD
ncbi:MAG: hypothetical protein AB9842_05250 [Bacteroidales bacterium]